MTIDPALLSDLINKHSFLVASSSILGLVTAARKAGTYVGNSVLAALRGFPVLHRAFYDCLIKCAENRRRFQDVKAGGSARLTRVGQ